MIGFDVLLHGGWVADGTGAPPFRADVGVRGTRIEAVGRLAGATAVTELDVTGRYVMPGFIDVHSHADALADTADAQLAALRQGVTTLILGQDGLSFAPASRRTIRFVERYFGPVDGACPPALAGGCSVADLLAHYDRATALNVAYLAPAGTIRAEAIGPVEAAADANQLAAMRRAVERALADGALGISTGLEYAPGRFADVAELSALCEPVAEAGGVYVTHMRGYEARAWQGFEEVTAIARRSGVTAHVSHLHGPANMLAGLLEAARADGLDVTFDSYPYLRGSSILTMVTLPPDMQFADPDDTLSALTEPASRRRLLDDWFPSVADVLDRVTFSYVASPEWAWCEGLPLCEAASRAGVGPGELVCDVLVASDLGAGCVFAQPPTSTEADVRALLRHEAHVGSSDGIMLGGRPHPRAWGAFARMLARYTRDLGDWTWGEAALHLAGHPARRFGLAGRGLLRAGYAADIAVVDPHTLTDRADYQDPRRPADGVDHVLVNGELALTAGALTTARPGRALRRAETPA